MKYDQPIYPIAVFSYDSPQRLDKNNYVVDLPGKQIVNFNYEIVQLNRLNWRDFLQQKNPVAASLMAKMKIAHEDRPIVKAECLRLLVTLKLDPAKMSLVSGFVDTYLRLNPAQLQVFNTQLDKMDVAEKQQIMSLCSLSVQLTTSWKEEGIALGITQGQCSTILRQLNRKLGQIDDGLQGRIQLMPRKQLDSLAEDLLDFQSTNDLKQWLDEHN